MPAYGKAEPFRTAGGRAAWREQARAMAGTETRPTGAGLEVRTTNSRSCEMRSSGASFHASISLTNTVLCDLRVLSASKLK